MTTHDDRSSAAEENFKAAFGRYPIRAELPEPSGDPADAAFAERFLRRGAPPKLRAVESRTDHR